MEAIDHARGYSRRPREIRVGVEWVEHRAARTAAPADPMLDKLRGYAVVVQVVGLYHLSVEVRSVPREFQSHIDRLRRAGGQRLRDVELIDNLTGPRIPDDPRHVQREGMVRRRTRQPGGRIDPHDHTEFRGLATFGTERIRGIRQRQKRNLALASDDRVVDRNR